MQCNNLRAWLIIKLVSLYSQRVRTVVVLQVGGMQFSVSTKHSSKVRHEEMPEMCWYQYLLLLQVESPSVSRRNYGKGLNLYFVFQKRARA